MADKKISELTPLTGANLADNDEFAVVDTSAVETKAITFGELKTALDTSTGFVRITGDTMTGGLTVPTVDINGGTIDGTVIGGSTPAAISGTTGQFGTSLNVDGTITSDGLTVSNSVAAGPVVATISNSGASGAAQLLLNNDVQSWIVNTRVDDAFSVFNATSSTTPFLIAPNGDISFYEDTGTTPKFFWDASAESLGIGTSSPAALLDVRADFPAIRSTNTGGAYAQFQHEGNNGIFDISTGSFVFRTSGFAERMRITSAGNVGIGTTSPDRPVHLSSSGTRNYFKAETTGATNASESGFEIKTPSANWLINSLGGTDALTFYDLGNGSERMRLDASGNLFVGKTADSVATDGFQVLNDGYLANTVSSSVVAYFNRRTSDGSIIEFRKDNTAVGSIGTGLSSLSVGTGNTQLMFWNAQSGIFPSNGTTVTDNSIDFGNPNYRFKDLYLSGGLRGDTLTFSNLAGSERMRIDSSGDVIVGRTTDVGGARFSVEHPTDCIGLNLGPSASGDRFLMFFTYNGSNVGSIKSAGASTSYNTSSDYRLKEDVQPMVGASDRLMALKPVNFAWKVDGSRVDGFIAHEAQEVVPECVSGEKDAVDKDGKPEYQGIDQSKLVPLLTAALQEALTKIEALEARITALEA